MTAREDYYFTQVVENYNSLFVSCKIIATERDTLLHEVNELKQELFKVYREIAELKGQDLMQPGERDLFDKIKNGS